MMMQLKGEKKTVLLRKTAILSFSFQFHQQCNKEKKVDLLFTICKNRTL